MITGCHGSVLHTGFFLHFKQGEDTATKTAVLGKGHSSMGRDGSEEGRFGENDGVIRWGGRRDFFCFGTREKWEDGSMHKCAKVRTRGDAWPCWRAWGMLVLLPEWGSKDRCPILSLVATQGLAEAVP